MTELPVIIDDDGQFAYSGKDSAIRQLIRDVYGTSYIEEKVRKVRMSILMTQRL